MLRYANITTMEASRPHLKTTSHFTVSEIVHYSTIRTQYCRYYTIRRSFSATKTAVWNYTCFTLQYVSLCFTLRFQLISNIARQDSAIFVPATSPYIDGEHEVSEEKWQCVHHATVERMALCILRRIQYLHHATLHNMNSRRRWFTLLVSVDSSLCLQTNTTYHKRASCLRNEAAARPNYGNTDQKDGKIT